MSIPQENQTLMRNTSMPKIRTQKVLINEEVSRQSTRKVSRKPKRVNDILDKMLRNDRLSQLVKDNKISGNCKSFDDVKNNPSGRRSSTIVTLKNKAYMFGGISYELMNDMHIFDFTTLKWKIDEVKAQEEEKMPREEYQNETNQIPVDMQGKIINSMPEPRFGHSLVRYKNTLILYGGENKYDKERKKRELYIDVYYYHILANVWEKISWREKIIYGRKYHAAVVIGTNMIVQGGYNPSSQVIDEMIQFNLIDHKWRDVGQSVSN
jgi:hypothetical protein